jgi:hypothetical protein
LIGVEPGHFDEVLDGGVRLAGDVLEGVVSLDEAASDEAEVNVEFHSIKSYISTYIHICQSSYKLLDCQVVGFSQVLHTGSMV